MVISSLERARFFDKGEYSEKIFAAINELDG